MISGVMGIVCGLFGELFVKVIVTSRVETLSTKNYIELHVLQINLCNCTLKMKWLSYFNFFRIDFEVCVSSNYQTLQL